MLKVLIADDEVLVRIGLKSAIHWEDYGFQLLEAAGDGQEAIEMILRDKPDILLTDIKMPRVDGIELIRWIRNENLNLPTIVLSCYDDFELVKEAMKLGASDYIRKLSMKPNDLVNVLLQLKDKILEKKALVGEYAASEGRDDVSGENLKNEFFTLLVKDDKEGDIGIIQPNIKVKWDGGYALCIQIDDYAAVTRQYKRTAVLHDSIKSMCEHIIKRTDICGEVFRLENDEYGIVLNSGTEDGKDLADIIKRELSNNVNISVSIGIGPYFKDRQGFVESYRLARNIRLLKFYEGRGARLFIDKKPDIKDKFSFIDVHPGTMLTEALESRNTDAAVKVVKRVFEEITEKGYVHPEISRKIALDLVGIFTMVAGKYNCRMDEFPDNGDVLPFRQITEAEFLPDLTEWFKKFTVLFIEFLDQCRQKNYSKLVLDTMDYIEKHKDTNPSLLEIAKAINTSEAYLSFLFKKETGKNLISHISEFKVSLAKDLLSTGMLVYEVSQRLGFDNSNYFSKVFKKYTGTTPENYKLNFKNKKHETAKYGENGENFDKKDA